jgi:hypothetical protein
MNLYSPINPEIFETTDDGWLFQSVFDHLATLLGVDWQPITNIEKLHNVPDAARHVWYAWWFAAEVGGNGLFDYLVNLTQSTNDIIHTLAALRAIGADDMTSRFTSAIVLSKSEGAELWLEPQSIQLASLQLDLLYPDFQAIEKAIYNEIQMPFSKAAAKFIRENRTTLL